MNEDKLKSMRAIVSISNKVEQIRKEIDILKIIRDSDTFIMTTFLAGDKSINNYSISITSSNIMDGDNGDLYDAFVNGLIESKEKELKGYSDVLWLFNEKIPYRNL